MEIIFVVYSLFPIWGLSEFIINRKKRVVQNKTIKDKNSNIQNIVIFLSLPIGIIFGLINIYANIHFLDFFGNKYFWILASSILLIIGIAIRWISIKTLDRYFSVNLTIQQDHKVIDFGIYKYIRHPSYLGAILSFLGFGFSFYNLTSFLIIFLPNLIVFLLRINFEEELLVDNLGSDYVTYKNKTKKLIPKIF